MLFENMVDDGLEYNIQTFAAMLEVYARYVYNVCVRFFMCAQMY